MNDVKQNALFIAGRELTYTRNDVLLRALRRSGWAVTEVGSMSPVRSISRLSLQLLPSLYKHLRTERYDLVLVGFYGYFLLPFVKLQTRAPVLFDAFISNYDTLCFDRQVFRPNSLLGRSTYHLDKSVCRWADHVLLDTPQHASYFIDSYDLPYSRVSWIPVGCNEEVFQSQPITPPKTETVVLHYSTFLPLHGVDMILQAAEQSRRLPIRFRLVGDGPLLATMQQLARQRDLTNVEFAPPIPLSQLSWELARAHICLGGHFGISEKSQRVVPGKIYQMMATQRTIIAADSPANRDLLTHGKSALLVPPGNSSRLAEAVQMLHDAPQMRAEFAREARGVYQAKCSEQVIQAKLALIVERTIRSARSR